MKKGPWAPSLFARSSVGHRFHANQRSLSVAAVLDRAGTCGWELGMLIDCVVLQLRGFEAWPFEAPRIMN